MLGALPVVSQNGQFIHLQGFTKLLLLRVLEGPSFLEADEHEVFSMGEGQGLPRGGDLGQSHPESLVALQLVALENHQESFPGPPEFQVQDLSSGESARFEDGEALGPQGLEVGTHIAFRLDGSGQGALGLPFQGLPQLAYGLKAEAEPGSHQLTLFRKGARSIPKICPMASMAWRWSEPSAVACLRKDWMAGWNWMA